MQRYQRRGRQLLVSALVLALAALIGGGAVGGHQSPAPAAPVATDPGGTGGSNGG
jgi:hypothetical protein